MSEPGRVFTPTDYAVSAAVAAERARILARIGGLYQQGTQDGPLVWLVDVLAVVKGEAT